MRISQNLGGIDLADVAIAIEVNLERRFQLVQFTHPRSAFCGSGIGGLPAEQELGPKLHRFTFCGPKGWLPLSASSKLPCFA